MNTELIRLKEVSKNVGLSTTTLRRMIKRGDLKGVIVGGNYYIRPNDYNDFMFGIDCKKMGVSPSAMKKYIDEEQKKKRIEMAKLMGIDNTNDNNKKLVMKLLGLI